MSLIKHIELAPHSTIWIWKNELSESELLNEVRVLEKEKSEYDEIRHSNRRIEWLVCRHVLDIAHVREEIEYLNNGKPVLKDGRHISISHCMPFVVVYVSDNPVGVDVQIPDPKLARIKQKFASGAELLAVSESSEPLDYLSILWSAKEAVFKVYGENIHFAAEMQVQPFEFPVEKINLKFLKKGLEREFNLKVIKIDDAYFVWNV